MQVTGPGACTLGSDDAWDAFMLGKGESVAGTRAPPCTLPALEPLSEALVSSADPAEPPFNAASAQGPLPVSLAPPLPPPKRRAYNPFLATRQPAEQQQQQQHHEAALESYADMPALWGDSSARPAIFASSSATVDPQPPPPQWQQEEAGEEAQGHASSGIAVQEQLDEAQLGQLQEQELVADPGSGGQCQLGEEELPQRYQLFLWRPEYAAAEPDFLHQQHAAAAGQAALLAADAAAKLEEAVSPSCLADSPSTSDSLTDSSSSSGGWDDTSSSVSSDCTPAAISR